MKRVFDPNEPEAMDRPQPVTPELEEALHTLASLNRSLGSHRLIRRFLDSWFAPGQRYRVLDLCTAVGDIPRAMIDWARPRQIELEIDAVDANESILQIAREASREYPGINFIRGDAPTFDSPGTYDLVICSLALHHFTEEGAIALLRRCRALSHRFVLVSDLERRWLTSLGAQFLAIVHNQSAITREDALASARSAFSFLEFQELAEAAGWRDFGHARFFICRQAIWLDSHDAGEIPLTDSGVNEVLPCPT